MRLSSLLPLHRPRHFLTVAIFGGHKIGAHQEQDDVGRVQLFLDFRFPLATRRDLLVIPGLDETLPSQRPQVFL